MRCTHCLPLVVTAALALRVAAVPQFNAVPFSPGFDVNKVLDQAQGLSSKSWEFGTASEALLELYNPSASVFGDEPFPVPTLSKDGTPSLAYAASKIQIGAPPNVLANGDESAGDPASLGVSAVLLGKTDKTFANAAAAELQYLLNGAPKYSNGAISQRTEDAELWSDFVYMAPPFIAYYAASINDLGTLQKAVDQCTLYRQVLQSTNGAWAHIVGGSYPDPGIWSTGNAWAAAGMTRVLATVMKAPIANSDGAWKGQASADLSRYIQEILDAAQGAPTADGLLINYWNDAANRDGLGFGETSGTSLLAYVAYRMAVMRPAGLSQQKASSYVAWADQVRKTVGGHVTSTGVVAPAADPNDPRNPKPDTSGSAEGQSIVVLMYAAWRDCVSAGICK